MALRAAEREELGVAQLGERYLGVVEVARSNRVTQTKKAEWAFACSAFFICATRSERATILPAQAPHLRLLGVVG